MESVVSLKHRVRKKEKKKRMIIFAWLICGCSYRYFTLSSKHNYYLYSVIHTCEHNQECLNQFSRVPPGIPSPPSPPPPISLSLTHTHTHTHTHTRAPLDLYFPPTATGDDSSAMRQHSTCAGIASSNRLQG